MSNASDILAEPVNIVSTIPENWSKKNLVDLCTPKQWKTISQNEMSKTGFPVFGANGFIGYYPEYNHENETIAITCRGATCGTVNLVPEKTYITGNSMCLDDVSRDTNVKYLYYASSYRTLSDVISGSAQPQITGESLRFVVLPIPPLPEQKKIASILTAVDEVIETTQKQIDKLQDLKKATMNELLTKGIGHTEFKDSELGRIPKSWEVKFISDLCEINTGKKDTQNKEEYAKYPFFVRSQKVERISTYSYDGEAILTAGDGVGTGKIYHYINGKFDFHQRVYKLSGFSVSIVGKYLFHYFSNNFLKQVQKFSAKGSVESVRMEMISGMKIPVPPKQEQIIISETLTSIERLIENNSEKINQTQSLKKSLMQDLLTGKVRVKVN